MRKACVRRNMESEVGWASMNEVGKKEEETVICPSSCGLRACVHYWFSYNVYLRTLAWFGLVSAYVLLGGLIFTLAERTNEVDTINRVQEERESAIQTINQLLVNRSDGRINETEAEEITEIIVELSDQLQELNIETNPFWEYGSSVFFATIVITTIGYGNKAPVTPAGQTLLVFYAFIGIPIALIFLATLGEILAGYLELIILRLGASKSIQMRLLLVITVASIGLLLFFFFPALIFNAIEPWNYAQSIYFCFVTLTTIGFGDYIPAEDCESRFGTGLLGLYRVCAAVWIWLGLAYVAMLITGIQKVIQLASGRCKKCICCCQGKVVATEMEMEQMLDHEEIPQEREERQEDYTLESPVTLQRDGTLATAL